MSETATTGSETHSHHHIEYAIVINGELVVVPHERVSYTEAAAIAYPVPADPNTTYVVTYHNAKGPKHEGILVEGEFVGVKQEGTSFDVTPAGKS